MRLIDADALLRDIESEINKKTKAILLADYNHYYCSGMRNAIRLVKRLPTVDDIKHGHWINIDAKFENMYVAHQCSICKSEFLGDASNYCPNCGARMDGEEND